MIVFILFAPAIRSLASVPYRQRLERFYRRDQVTFKTLDL
jgi:hypothetical protein